MRRDGLPGLSMGAGVALIATFFGSMIGVYALLSPVVDSSWLDVELPCASILAAMIVLGIVTKVMQRIARRRLGLITNESGPRGEAKLLAQKLRERAASIEQALSFGRELPPFNSELREMLENFARATPIDTRVSVPQEAMIGGPLQLERADRFAIEAQIARLRKTATDLDEMARKMAD